MRRLRRRDSKVDVAPPTDTKDETPSPETAETPESVPTAEPRRLTLRRGLPFSVNWSAALVIVALITLTVFALLRNQGLLPVEVLLWWPAVIVVPAIFWFFASLARQNPQALVGSTALLGLSISLLLASQNIAPLGTTFIGVTFIAAGTGVILRGILLRHQPVA